MRSFKDLELPTSLPGIRLSQAALLSEEGWAMNISFGLKTTGVIRTDRQIRSQVNGEQHRRGRTNWCEAGDAEVAVDNGDDDYE